MMMGVTPLSPLPGADFLNSTGFYLNNTEFADIAENIRILRNVRKLRTGKNQKREYCLQENTRLVTIFCVCESA